MKYSKDSIERLEDGAEVAYYKMLQPDGKLKCWCGKIFNEDEGTVISSNPYAMPVCGDCFLEWEKEKDAGDTRKMEETIKRIDDIQSMIQELQEDIANMGSNEDITPEEEQRETTAVCEKISAINIIITQATFGGVSEAQMDIFLSRIKKYYGVDICEGLSKTIDIFADDTDH